MFNEAFYVSIIGMRGGTGRRERKREREKKPKVTQPSVDACVGLIWRGSGTDSPARCFETFLSLPPPARKHSHTRTHVYIFKNALVAYLLLEGAPTDKQIHGDEVIWFRVVFTPPERRVRADSAPPPPPPPWSSCSQTQSDPNTMWRCGPASPTTADTHS